MPWCPKCKNEYKDGIEVCADCGCKLLDKLGAEMVAYFGPEDEADKLVDYLESNGFDFAYKQYNSREGRYEVLIQESKVEELRPCMSAYYNKIRAAESKNIDTYSDMYASIGEDEPIVTTRYKKPSERATEYKAGAGTLLLLGILGMIVLLLIDFGVIPLFFTTDRKILINTVMGGTFILFIGLGINSFLTYKKLLIQTQIDDDLEKSIVEWFNANVSKEAMTKNENPEETEEMLYFSRFKYIKSKISSQFSDADPAFVEYLADKLYNDIFK